MFRNEEEFNRLVGGLPIDTQVDPAHKKLVRRRMLEQHAQVRQSPPGGRMARSIGWARRPSVKTKSLAALAAVLLITAGILAVVYYGAGAKIALADVQQRLVSVSVIGFRMEMGHPGGMNIDFQVYVTEDRIARFEVDGGVSLIDFEHGRRLDLMPARNFAIEGNVQGIPGDPFCRNWLEDLRQCVGREDARCLGDKTVDGVRAIGWEIQDGQEIVTVWADAATAELVRVEVQREQVRMALSRFRYDVDYDKAKFSLVPPPGYTVRAASVDFRRSSEAEVALVLRICAIGNGDVFPNELDAMTFSQVADKVDWNRVRPYMAETGSPDNVTQVIQQAFSWLAYEPSWTYAGAGVKLGDAGRAIFWHRPAGGTAWRVIYGDLHVETADEPPG